MGTKVENLVTFVPITKEHGDNHVKQGVEQLRGRKAMRGGVYLILRKDCVYV
jgi:hypothetical protein